MKKLALALVCLVSVAFFASCTETVENAEPRVAVMTGENYLYDGQVIELNTDYMFGFVVASNAQTQKELSSLSVKIGDEETIETISGTEYTYIDTVNFVLEREIIGTVEITATVTDVAGNVASKTITLSVNQEDNLEETAFTWNRHGGNDATGLADFGLKWTKNERAIYAVIEPVDNAILYQFNPSVWSETTTGSQKAALFETGVSISQWKEFNVAGAVDQTLDVVLGTSYNGELHLMHVTNGHIETFKGTDVTLTGMAK